MEIQFKKREFDESSDAFIEILIILECSIKKISTIAMVYEIICIKQAFWHIGSNILIYFNSKIIFMFSWKIFLIHLDVLKLYLWFEKHAMKFM